MATTRKLISLYKEDGGTMEAKWRPIQFVESVATT
jgi:hypothetical protein